MTEHVHADSQGQSLQAEPGCSVTLEPLSAAQPNVPVGYQFFFSPSPSPLPSTLCVHVCIMFMYVGVLESTCTYMCIHVEAQSWVSSLITLHFIYQVGDLLNPALPDLD